MPAAKRAPKKKAPIKKTAIKKEAAVEEVIVEEVIEEVVNTDEGSFVLPRSMEISSIEKIYEDMLEKIKGTYKKFVVDGGEVALVDAAGVQLLVHFLRTLKSTGCEVSWENYSIQIYQVAAELSLDEELGE